MFLGPIVMCDISYQCSNIIDGETLVNVREAGLEINRLLIEDTQTENVP